MTIDPVFNWIAALALIQLFASAAWHKVSNVEHFTRTLDNYQIAPRPLLSPLAMAVISFEVATTLLLILPEMRTVGALLAIALLTVYALAMAINLLKGRTRTDCGCHFGRRKQPVSWFLIARNCLLIALGALLIIPAASRSLTLLDFGCILFAFTLCPLVYGIAHGLHHNNTLQQG